MSQIRRWLVLGIAIALYLGMAGSSLAVELGNPPPLPEELNDYYWSTREPVLFNLIPIKLALSFAISPNPTKQLDFLMEAIYHDSGTLDTPTSAMAAEYLRENVVDPLLEQGSLELYDGTIWDISAVRKQYGDMEPEKLQRLLDATLLYYYARDYVLFATPSGEGGIGGILGSMSLPYILAYPCESVVTGRGICWNQGITLATLYRLAGFEVALYLTPAAPFPNPMSCFIFDPIGFYHAMPLLKDEGWGIGRWSFPADSMGNPMEGDWILQDPMYDPAYFSGNPLAGTALHPLEFDDDSPYVIQPGLGSIAQICGKIPFFQYKFITTIPPIEETRA